MQKRKNYTRNVEQFQIHFTQVLGTGKASEVCLGTELPSTDESDLEPPADNQYAVKIINKQQNYKIAKNLAKKTKDEIDYITTIVHPNLIKVHKIYQSKKNIYIIMDKCNGYSLETYLTNQNRISEYKALTYFK